jgi:NAD(P)-dependent dehydrogenase (short-subunit alcohol dehydrogenase family)
MIRFGPLRGCIFGSILNKLIMSKLKNKLAVIIGGNSGIGFGIAQELKNEGAKGVIVGRNQATFFAKAFSSDLLNRKIRVNVITPGTTDTPAFEKFVPAEQIEGIKKHFASEMPIGRIGQPSDIGKTAVFLASDDSSFMLGADLLVDGGMTYLSK